MILKPWDLKIWDLSLPSGLPLESSFSYQEAHQMGKVAGEARLAPVVRDMAATYGPSRTVPEEAINHES